MNLKTRIQLYHTRRPGTRQTERLTPSARGCNVVREPAMNRTTAAFLCAFFLCACTRTGPHTQTRETPDTGTEKGAVTIAVSADLHYTASPSELYSILIPQLVYIEEITSALLDSVISERPDAFILCGDLTNDGKKADHAALAAKLEKVRAAGIPVFVIPGNHDIHDTASAREFRRTYARFGYTEALFSDAQSLSYVVPLTDSVWLFMLDTNTYGDTGSSSGGSVSGGTYAWLETCLSEAARQGAVPLTVTHHNLLARSGTRKSALPVQNSSQLAGLFTQYGVPLNISGHSHTQYISSAAASGKTIYDVSIGMPAAYPNTYGVFSIAPEKIVYRTRPADIEGAAKRNGSRDRNLLHFTDYSSRMCLRRGEDIAEKALENASVPGSAKEGMKKMFAAVWLGYSGGDLYLEKDRLLASPEYARWETYDGVWPVWLESVLREAGGSEHSLTVPLVPQT